VGITVNPFKENPLGHLSKPQIYAVTGGSVLVLGVIVYKHHSSTGSWNPFSGTGATTATGAIDPVTGLPVSQDDAIDPVTQLAYLAEAQQYGSVAAAEAAVSAYGQGSDTGSGTGVSPASPGTGVSPAAPVTSAVYTSDAAWVQACVAGLASVGYDQTSVASALGDYVTNTPVTAAEAQLIRVAISEYGPSPENHQIILQPASKPAPVKAASKVKVPDVAGKDAVTAQAAITAAGLKSTLSGPKFTAGKGTRVIEFMNPKADTEVTKGSHVTLGYKITT
jgi:hypothetical protein